MQLCFGILLPFFDTVDPALLFEAAIEHSFPLVPFVLAFRMHLAPRRLQFQGSVGPIILPAKSVIPGCSFAIPFVRLLLRTRLF